MNGCRDCQNTTAGVCWRHAMQIGEVVKNYNMLDPQAEIERLRLVIEEIRMVANCYSEPEAARLAVISQRCKDALAGGKP